MAAPVKFEIKLKRSGLKIRTVSRAEKFYLADKDSQFKKVKYEMRMKYFEALKDMIRGMCIEDIAIKYGVCYSTCREQLKATFARVTFWEEHYAAKKDVVASDELS